jgi:predicted metal-dependent enzyme (double-stranded beta helix superfamily)
MATYYLTQNDAGVTMTATLKNADGTAIDLTDATVVFHCGQAGDAANAIVDAAAVVLDGAAGRVAYAWTAADTAEAGTYDAEFQISWGTVIRTVPSRSGAFKVVIRPEVA